MKKKNRRAAKARKNEEIGCLKEKKIERREQLPRKEATASKERRMRKKEE